MKVPMSKAKAIDLKKDKFLLGALALIASLAAMAFLSSSAQAHVKDQNKKWTPYSQGEDAIKLPFKLNSQILNH